MYNEGNGCPKSRSVFNSTGGWFDSCHTDVKTLNLKRYLYIVGGRVGAFQSLFRPLRGNEEVPSRNIRWCSEIGFAPDCLSGSYDNAGSSPVTIAREAA